MSHIPSFLERLVVAAIGAGAVALVGAGERVSGHTGATAAGTQTLTTPQATPAQSWIRIDTVQVKPEMWNQYRDIERDEVIPALRKAGVPSRAAWRTAEFGTTYELVLVRPVPDFGEYDAGDALTKGMGAREAERLRERLRRCLVSRESAAVLQRSDLSVGETGRPFAVVTTLAVAPGRGGEYEAFLRETLPDVRKAGIVFGVYQRVYGQQTAWLLVQNLDSLKELAQAPSGFFRAFGEDDAERRLSKLAGIVTSVERKVFRFDPELSFSFPGPTSPAR
jgi:hypothetical protein